MKTENKPLKTPKEDLMNAALKHYEEAANAIHHFNSDIPKAIRQYYSIDQPDINTPSESNGISDDAGVFFIGEPESKTAEEIKSILESCIKLEYYTEWVHEEPHIRSRI